MRVLITGGSGFIGTNLVESFRQDHEVVSLDVRAPMHPRHSALWVKVDLLDVAEMGRVFHGFEPEIVLHFGARTDLHGANLTDYAANIQGVRNVVSSVAGLRAPAHTVYASSRLVFAVDHQPAHDYDYKPSTVYGQSKIEGEHIVRSEAARGGTWTLVRPTSIWGPWFSTPYRDFFDSIERGQYVRVPGIAPKKSFGYVGNAVHEVRRIVDAPTNITNEKVMWLTDYPFIDVNTWANVIADNLGVRRPIAVPGFVLRLAARLGDLLQQSALMKEPPLTSFRLKNLLTDMIYETSSLEAISGALPYTLEAGVHETVQWIRGNV